MVGEGEGACRRRGWLEREGYGGGGGRGGRHAGAAGGGRRGHMLATVAQRHHRLPWRREHGPLSLFFLFCLSVSLWLLLCFAFPSSS